MQTDPVKDLAAELERQAMPMLASDPEAVTAAKEMLKALTKSAGRREELRFFGKRFEVVYKGLKNARSNAAPSTATGLIATRKRLDELFRAYSATRQTKGGPPAEPEPSPEPEPRPSRHKKTKPTRRRRVQPQHRGSTR